MFLVMEYFPYGDLAQYLETPLEEFEVKQIAMDLLEGLKIMHAEGFTHRSLKPQVCSPHMQCHILRTAYEVLIKVIY